LAQNRNAASFYPDSSDSAELQLRNAASHVRDRQWSEAITIYQRVIDEFGDKVTRLPRETPGLDPSGDFALYVDGRRYCHRSIAALPPEARALYRDRIDPRAAQWFKEGQSRRNHASLRKVVDLAFCSSYGDDALELLGDLAFQDGRFAEALATYRRLVADSPSDQSELVHPDPSVDLARIAAKKLLCRAAAGENPPTAADIDALNQRFPAAAGSLAGRKGAYAQIVRDSLAADHLEPPGQADSRWPTFAGSLRRTKVLPNTLDVGQKQWRVELEKINAQRRSGPYGGNPIVAANPASGEKLLAYHPIVLGDQIVVCDGARVLAYNLNDRPAGPDANDPINVEPAWKYDPENAANAPQAQRAITPVPRYTLTAVGSRIYARMGGSSALMSGRMSRNGIVDGSPSSIVALDWNAQGKFLWEAKSTALTLRQKKGDRPNTNRTVNFEGTPVATANSVFVAVTERLELTGNYIACFDAETGDERWVHYLGSGSVDGDHNMPGMMAINGMGMNAPSGGPGDYFHRLLTLDGPTIYYLSNMGALVAIEADTGATLWVATYPRQDSTRFSQGTERDLNPAVVDGGRVFIAPSDSNCIFAFDATSGKLLWKTEPIADDVKLSHVLGVAKGRLIVTGDRALLFDVKTGKLAGSWPDSSNKSLEGYGRGLLAGDMIYWPTRNDIQILDQRTGLRSEPPIKLAEAYHTTGGNLAAGDGYLVVSKQDGIVVFCQNSRLIERYKNEIVRAPDQAANYYRLARAAEAIGRDSEALEAYRMAVDKARSSETIDGVPLTAASRDHLFRLLLRLAATERKAKRYAEAVDRLDAAAEFARNDPARLEARLQLADVLLDAGRPRDAVDVLSKLLAEPQLRPLAVPTPDNHRTIRADLFIADRFASILKEHGRAVYDVFDDRARQLYERGKKEKDTHVLDEVCRDFPASTTVPDALLELGSLHEAAHRLIDACHAYKRVLVTQADDRQYAEALWRLARVYDARQLFVSARDAYLELQTQYPKVMIGPPGGQTAVATLVPLELAKAPYSQLVADRPRPPLPVPLVRRWSRPSSNGADTLRTLSLVGVAPSLDTGKICLLDQTGLQLIDPNTGAARWTASLGSPVIWSGYLADLLIAATPRQIVALEPSKGTVQWRYDTAADPKAVDRPDPFAPPEEQANKGSQALHDFQIVRGRVFCLRGSSELIALDGDTGSIDWSYSSAQGKINPHLWIGADRTVIHVDKPNQILVLRTDDGQEVTQTALAEGDELKRPPVPIDEDSVLIVSDQRTVKKIDLNHARTAWIYRRSDDLPVEGPPRVIGDAGRLFVLHDGHKLIRLDSATGSERWVCDLSAEDLSERPRAIAYDDERLFDATRQSIKGGYCVALRARSLSDGKPLWAQRLEGPENVAWAVILTDRYVIAYPERASGDDADASDNLPVVVRRKDTGALVQRFLFPTKIADINLKVDARGALLATPRGLWGLGQSMAQTSINEERNR
jgi:outer membrane protein assembly factor BamB/Flp pilus assembly protein TadD